MLSVLRQERFIRLLTSGRLLPWVGMALRGMLARHFKSSVCVYSQTEQDSRWRYCKGCPQMASCAYGQCLEPDPPKEVKAFRGQEDGVRPMVLAPAFPLDTHGAADSAIPVRLTLIGTSATAHATSIWQMLDEVGQDPMRGLGQDRILFEMLDEDETPTRHWHQPVDLPLTPSAVGGVVPRLGIDLRAPLFLNNTIKGRKRLNSKPSFGDLLRVSLRTLGALYRLLDQSLDADFAALKEEAEKVEMAECHFETHRQPHHSSRSKRQSQLRAIVGHAVYRDVPMALARWVLWGGRVHVGQNRVAGAGCWDVAWSDFQGKGDVPPDSWQWLE